MAFFLIDPLRQQKAKALPTHIFFWFPFFGWPADCHKSLLKKDCPRGRPLLTPFSFYQKYFVVTFLADSLANFFLFLCIASPPICALNQISSSRVEIVGRKCKSLGLNWTPFTTQFAFPLDWPGNSLASPHAPLAIDVCVPPPNQRAKPSTIHRTHWNRCFAAAANLFRPHFAAAKHIQSAPVLLQEIAPTGTCH